MWEYTVPDIDETKHRYLHSVGQEFDELGRALAASVQAATGSGSLGSVYRGQTEARWLEIAALLTSIGEVAQFAALALLENTAAWDHVDDRHDGEAHAIALRCDFISEAIQLHLLALGHQLANLSFRFFLTSSAATDAVSNSKMLRTAAAAAIPWTDNPKAWLYQRQLQTLRRELVGSSIERAKVVRAVARLDRTAAWTDLNSARGRSFHRWRDDVGGQRDTGFAAMKGRHGVSSRAAVEATKTMWATHRAMKETSPRAAGVALVPHIRVMEADGSWTETGPPSATTNDTISTLV